MVTDRMPSNPAIPLPPPLACAPASHDAVAQPVTTPQRSEFTKVYEPGVVLFHQDDRGDCVYILQSGSVVLRRYAAGRERVLTVLSAGEIFGELAVLTGSQRSATAVVRERARLLVLPRAVFIAMIQNNTEIALRIIRIMARRFAHASQHMELFLFARADQRVVIYLSLLAEELGQNRDVGSGAVYIPLTLQELADRTLVSRDDAVEVVERLAEHGLLIAAAAAEIDGPGYVVAEPELLRQFLDDDDSRSDADDNPLWRAWRSPIVSGTCRRVL